MGFPKVKGGMSSQGTHNLPVKDRAKFVKKISLPTVQAVTTNQKGA
jgi:hypothetical protein